MNTSSKTDSVLAMLLALSVGVPALLGDSYSFKPFFYILIIVPAIAMVLAGKTNLLTLFRRYPYVLMLAIPLLYWSASSLWSINPDNFGPLLRRSLTIFIFIIFVAQITSKLETGILRYLDVALYIVAVGALIHLVDLVTADPRGPLWRLGDDTIFNRALHAAHYFGFFAVYGLVRFYQEARPEKAWLYLAALAPCLVFVLATESRGPILSFLLLYLVISIFWFRKPIHAIGVLLLTATVGFFSFDTLLERGHSYRLEIWQGSLELIQQNFWFGVGFGERLNVPYGDGWLAPHAHNQFLDILARSGVLGLIMIAVIAAYVVYRAAKASPMEKIFVATLLFFFASMMTDVHKLVNSPSGTYVVFWLPLVVLLVLTTGRKQTPRQ